MLADRIFGAPARRDPPRRRKKPARGRNPKPAARGRGRGRRRASPEVMQRRLDLAGLACIGLAVYLGYVIYLGWNGGTVGDGLAHGSLLCRRRRRDRGAGRPRARRRRTDPASVPALSEVGGGGRRSDRRRAAARAGRADRRPRARGSAKGAVRSGLLPSITAGAWARSSTGRRARFSIASARTSWLSFCRLGPAPAHRPLCLRHGPRRAPRLRSRQARHGRLRNRDQGEPHQNRSRPDRYCPGRHRARLRAPGARRGWRGLPRRGRGR